MCGTPGASSKGIFWAGLSQDTVGTPDAGLAGPWGAGSPGTAEPRLLSCRICFPVQVNRLPRETLLSVTLFAVPVPPPGSSSDANKQRRVPEALGWVTTPLFNFRQYVGCPAMMGTARDRASVPRAGQGGSQRGDSIAAALPPSCPSAKLSAPFSSRVLTCGRKLLGLWPATQDNSRARSSAPNFNQPDSVILQVRPGSGGSWWGHSQRFVPAYPLPLPQIDFPTSAFEVKFTSPPAAEFSPKYEFGSLGEEDQCKLREAMQKKSLYW